MKTRLRNAGKACVVALMAACVAQGQPVKRTPIASTRYFVFYNDFVTNLNDALIAAGVARKANQPELFHAGDEKACFDKLPSSVRTAWDSAVDYYAKIVSPGKWIDRPQYLVRLQLAGLDDDIKETDARQYMDIVAGFRTAAGPAYRSCRWAEQDAKNRKWIDDLKPRLAAHEEKIGTKLEQLYQQKWSQPVPVDIVETVDWSGANTVILGEGRGHLLVSNDFKAWNELEIVFHEASHLLMDRNDPVYKALDKAASAASKRLPPELWHVVLFYTTGEAVRHVLKDAAQTEYKPMIVEMWERGIWAADRQPVESTWPNYVDGQSSLEQASTKLVEAVPQPAKH